MRLRFLATALALALVAAAPVADAQRSSIVRTKSLRKLKATARPNTSNGQSATAPGAMNLLGRAHAVGSKQEAEHLATEIENTAAGPGGSAVKGRLALARSTNATRNLGDEAQDDAFAKAQADAESETDPVERAAAVGGMAKAARTGIKKMTARRMARAALDSTTTLLPGERGFYLAALADAASPNTKPGVATGSQLVAWNRAYEVVESANLDPSAYPAEDVGYALFAMAQVAVLPEQVEQTLALARAVETGPAKGAALAAEATLMPPGPLRNGLARRAVNEMKRETHGNPGMPAAIAGVLATQGMLAEP